MPNPGSIIGQISEEFGEIGKQVVKETIKAPKDITGKALESLGTSSGKQQGSQAQQQGQKSEGGALDTFTATKDATAKKTIARAALEELAGHKPKPKEPSVRERIEAEEKQKKELLAKGQAQAADMQLPAMSQKPKRGNLYGIGVKQSLEKSRNVRQD